jgi:hypothetical protein
MSGIGQIAVMVNRRRGRETNLGVIEKPTWEPCLATASSLRVNL